jgi:Ca-activated chloride channel family protein
MLLRRLAEWQADAMTYPAKPKRPARALPAIAAVVAGIVLIALVRSFSGGDGSTGASNDPTKAESSCEGPATDLVLAVSPEKTAILTEVAQEYAKTDGQSDAGCVNVIVSEKSSGAAQTALARGWNEAADGPRPDVWSPSSSSWPGLLSDALRKQDKPGLVPEELPSLVRTPLVIAMPQPMAEVLGWPGKQPGWSDLLALSRDPKGWGGRGHPEFGPFRLGKTNPELSTSGLHALVGANFAATGLSSDLTAANINDPKVRSYVGGIEQAAVHYGPTTLTFLANQAKADRDGRGLTYVSAIAVEEKSLLDYNRGDPSVGGNGSPPRIPLAAIYPKEGTVVSDNPYVTLTADWVDANKQAAAKDFLAFATSAQSQKRFTDIGFRGPDGRAGALVAQKNGALPDQPKLELSPPAPPVLALIRDSWKDLRKKARVLFVIDRSGSMEEDNRIELARDAAAKAFDGFGPADQVGLATFSSDYRIDVPIGLVRTNLAALKAKARALFPEGGTALYASTRKAHEQMEREFQPGLINAVVVMTDGKNDDPDSDLNRLLADLRPGEDTSRTVRVFTVAFGADASLPELKEIADASTGASYDARKETSIEKVLSDVVSNF